MKGQIQSWQCALRMGFEPLPLQQPLGSRETVPVLLVLAVERVSSSVSFNDNFGLSFGSALEPSDPCLVSMRYRKAGPSAVVSAPVVSVTSSCHPGVCIPALRILCLFPKNHISQPVLQLAVAEGLRQWEEEEERTETQCFIPPHLRGGLLHQTCMLP